MDALIIGFLPSFFQATVFSNVGHLWLLIMLHFVFSGEYETNNVIQSLYVLEGFAMYQHNIG